MIASASAAAPRRARDCIDSFQLVLSSRLAAAPRRARDCINSFQLVLSSRLAAASHRLRPLQLLLSIASASAAALNCVRFDCFPIASASAAAPPIVSASTLLPDGVRFVCCSPIAVNCCSPIASASAAAPRQLFWKVPAMSTILEHSMQSLRSSELKYEGRTSL